MNEKRRRKSVENLKYILEKNIHKINRLIVSVSFMEGLAQVADLIDIAAETFKDNKQHDFKEVHASYTEENEMWFLWGIPIMLSNSLAKNAIAEMKDGSSVVIEGI